MLKINYNNKFYNRRCKNSMIMIYQIVNNHSSKIFRNKEVVKIPYLLKLNFVIINSKVRLLYLAAIIYSKNNNKENKCKKTLEG